MKVIGLTGAAGAGKDTVCKIALEWCEREGYEARRVAFADPLKVSAAACFGIPSDEALDFCNNLKQPGRAINICGLNEEEPHVKLSLSGRTFLQFFGTEAHRDVFGEDFWTNETKRIIHELDDVEGVDIVFITDVRFSNEAAFVYSEDDWHGEIWKVYRAAAAPVEAHASESGIAPYVADVDIDNSGSIADLTRAVRCVCEDGLEVI